jgi:hypothetical protein
VAVNCTACPGSAEAFELVIAGLNTDSTASPRFAEPLDESVLLPA